MIDAGKLIRELRPANDETDRDDARQREAQLTTVLPMPGVTPAGPPPGGQSALIAASSVDCRTWRGCAPSSFVRSM